MVTYDAYTIVMATNRNRGCGAGRKINMYVSDRLDGNHGHTRVR